MALAAVGPKQTARRQIANWNIHIFYTDSTGSTCIEFLPAFLYAASNYFPHTETREVITSRVSIRGKYRNYLPHIETREVITFRVFDAGSKTELIHQ